MKIFTIILTLLILPPLTAQTEEQDVYVQTGLILQVKDNKINFEERWFPVVQNEKNILAKNSAQQLITIDQSGNQISHNDIVAPCLVNVTYQMDKEGNMLPVKIKILEQYQYDSHGLIKKRTIE